MQASSSIEPTPENTIVISNPLAFMTKSYILKILKNYKYITNDTISSISLNIHLKNQLPNKVYITFSKDEMANKFLTQFTNKSFEPTLDYKLQISKEVPSKNEEEVLDGKKMTFALDYPHLFQKAYEIKDTDPGLILIDKDFIERQSRAVKWLLQKISSSILKGQSIMNISLPVYIFDKRTMLQVFAYELRSAPYFLSRAFYTPNPIERLKWVNTFLLSQIFVSPLQTKPFNPILGETYQAKIGDMNIYLEQTVNKPPTANFYCYDDSHTYKFYGYIATSASTGANSCKALKLGKIYLEFKDGAKYRIYYPAVWISGTMFGKKLFNYKNTSLVVDEKNNYGAYVKFNLGDKGLFKKMFSSSKAILPDIIKGDILQMKDITIDTNGAKHKREKKGTSYAVISGRWTTEIKYDEEVFWNREDRELLDMIEPDFKLPSDSSHRADLNIFLTGKEEEAQIEKEKLEELQRNDRKLREPFNKEMIKEEKKEKAETKAKEKEEKKEKAKKDKEEKAKREKEQKEQKKREKEQKAKEKEELKHKKEQEHKKDK